MKVSQSFSFERAHAIDPYIYCCSTQANLIIPIKTDLPYGQLFHLSPSNSYFHYIKSHLTTKENQQFCDSARSQFTGLSMTSCGHYLHYKCLPKKSANDAYRQIEELRNLEDLLILLGQPVRHVGYQACCPICKCPYTGISPPWKVLKQTKESSVACQDISGFFNKVLEEYCETQDLELAEELKHPKNIFELLTHIIWYISEMTFLLGEKSALSDGCVAELVRSLALAGRFLNSKEWEYRKEAEIELASLQGDLVNTKNFIARLQKADFVQIFTLGCISILSKNSADLELECKELELLAMKMFQPALISSLLAECSKDLLLSSNIQSLIKKWVQRIAFTIALLNPVFANKYLEVANAQPNLTTSDYFCQYFHIDSFSSSTVPRTAELPAAGSMPPILTSPLSLALYMAPYTQSSYLPAYTKFSLVRMEPTYIETVKIHYKRICANCHTQCKDNAICLICNATICISGQCCIFGESKSEAIQHAEDCGSGIGIYFYLSENTLILVNKKDMHKVPSFYLNAHNEWVDMNKRDAFEMLHLDTKILQEWTSIYLRGEIHRVIEHERMKKA